MVARRLAQPERMPRMRKVLVGVAVGVIVVGALVQLVVPGFAERRAESRLETDDEIGTAVVDIKSFPAIRLLWGSGDRFEARGRGLRIDLDKRTDDPLGRLDGFDEVDIRFEDLSGGPVRVQEFSLVRGEDDESFFLRMDAETTPQALAEAAGGEIGGSLGQAIGAIAGDLLPGAGATDVPMVIDGQINRTNDGGVDVDEVEASVAGIPAGPFAELMVQAVVERL